ncbi:hypothetical protein SARC_01500 [Sphaeroforma arctica JP610]|uniref:Uncharacterized protein n=1 Tax=Sphaeroforma arctica JP610 TaxID=667725 RepID=A0A0L0GBS2_9EUKA|nr:hypothetical protein SARC_01500 [Sphaeroforma arctica JP610]KNC86341.1 hypothetical protein SARC_01500 [Sphaeroforma arctica JP610]|eukprot:XP_014160243.1 hypothetical protein SARC_01500 [Sphaeroforma arctica JP610]
MSLIFGRRTSSGLLPSHSRRNNEKNDKFFFITKVAAVFVVSAVAIFYFVAKPTYTETSDVSIDIVDFGATAQVQPGNSKADSALAFDKDEEILNSIEDETINQVNDLVAADTPKPEPLEGMKYGAVRLPSGRAVNFVGSVCVGRAELAYVFDTEVEAAHMKDCCFGNAGTKHCTAVEIGLCQSMQTKIRQYASKPGRDIQFWTKKEVEQKKLRVLPGLTLWANTVTDNEQIGHLINKDLLFFNLHNDVEHMPKIDYFVFPKMAAPQGPHAVQFTETILGEMWEKNTFWGDQIQRKKDFPDHMVCFERAVEGEVLHDETVFDNMAQGDQFRQFAVENLGAKHFGEGCPPLDAVVLRRTEGTGLRSILNYDVIDRVFKRNGINSYKNVTVAGADDTTAHVNVFSNFGLMVASHSSQLKNLIFSAKNSIVIETKGTEVGYMDPSPFQEGVDEPLGIIYKVSNGHKPDYTSCPEDHGCTKLKKYKVDYWLDEEVFEADLLKVLEIRRERCGEL